MCGIAILVGEGRDGSFVDFRTVNNVLSRRGPDHYEGFDFGQESSLVTMIGSVLHMRGRNMLRQPLRFGTIDAAFCWNGEVYEFLQPTRGNNCRDNIGSCAWEASDEIDGSDTMLVAGLLEQALTTIHTDATTSSHSTFLVPITNVMSRMWNAEFTFVVLTQDFLYFGRDCMGRRSLLSSQKDNVWMLSSVAFTTDDDWTEVPPGKVFEYQLETGEIRSETLRPLAPESKPFSLPITPPECPDDIAEGIWIASIGLEHHLIQAVRRRLVGCWKDDAVAVLFSGGLDSAVLAGMAASLLSPNNRLELFNVAFGSGHQAADRRAAVESYEELKGLFPHRDIRLVCVNVAEWEHVVREEKHIQQLIYPKTSVMDLNIGTALWFASRGDDGDPSPKSGAKIMLVGMGADEQMGGYGRHRKASASGRLREELDMDTGRLWERNLGRDDRIISDHGKEARFPYLDANVMDFLASTKLEDICDFSMEPGVGDKRILRLIAQRMGLVTASGLVKRAIQFGSRIAHESDRRRFGSRRQAKGGSDFRKAQKH